MKLFRKILITESIAPEGMRRLESMTQSFESDSGQVLSLQDAESLALNNLGPNRTHQTYQSQSGRRFLVTLKELVYSIAAWPAGFCQSELLAAIFGPAHFDARSIEARGICHLEEQSGPGYQLQSQHSLPKSETASFTPPLPVPEVNHHPDR
jgi:hypothetical protein